MTRPVFLRFFGQAASFARGDGVARQDRVALLKMPRAILFAGLAISCLLPACATTSMPSVEQGESEGISGYVACLDAAAWRLDDRRSDVATIAAAVRSACATKFTEPVKMQGATMNAAARQKYEERLQARQLELSTMAVLDVRGQP
ncbi:MAG: hypothetical protein WB677_00295 [Xanthobacteraceae bacterium]